MAWAQAMTEKVNQISETTVNLWTTFMSPGVNTLYWTTFAEDLATLEATNDKLMTDSGYLMLLEQGARYMSADPINDALMQIMHAEGFDPSRPPAYVAEVAAVLAPGAAARGLELGVEITQRAHEIAGCGITFGMAATGVYGAVAWHSAYDSITELQTGETAIFSDQKFIELLDDKAKGVYQPAAQQAIYRRLM
jgi:hypothetical protein